MTKIYIVKNCTVKGHIHSYECKLSENKEFWVHKPEKGLTQAFSVNDCHLSFNAALVEAEKLRLKKITSLKRKLKNFSLMNFIEVEVK